MGTGKTFVVATALLACAHAVAAQQLPRPNEPPRGVTLPLAEYNRLIDLASRPPDPGAPPVPAVLASAELRVRVERDTARGVFNLNGDVLRAGVSRVALMSGATLIEANVAGRPVPLVAEGQAHAALLPGPGPFSLALEWGAPLKLTPGRASFVVPVPPAGSARATIDLPGDQADVHLSAGLITRRSNTAGRTIVEATLDPGSATEVWWSMRDSAPVAAAREIRTLSDVLTLLTIGDSDVRMVALVDLTVVQGTPRTTEVRLPAGYELTGVSGSSLESSDQRDGIVVLTVSEPAARRHQFLLSLERQHDGGSFTLDTGVVSLPDTQRERGEIAIEGVGTLELAAEERDGVRRMDVRELNTALQALARLPILSAFRYQRSATTPASLALNVTRFADSGVLAAVADRAVATTLVTSEGRALTEVRLTLQNRAQPFLKVTLPPGASIVSVDVAGESAKPALGADGTRVPLLRTGFRPSGPYEVTFVYLHPGTPFAKKGEMDMTLPRMDIPVGIVEWEVFAPDNYSLRAIDGNVLDRLSALMLADKPVRLAGSIHGGVTGGVTGGIVGGSESYRSSLPAGVPGEIRGRVMDTAGGVVPGVTIVLEAGGTRRVAASAEDGSYRFTGVAPGPLSITAALPGFESERQSLLFDQEPQQIDFRLAPGGLSESVTVSGDTPRLDASNARVAPRPAPPSQNVIDLQKRAAGVLPIRVDVPRAGTSHRFVKPLVVDQEATVTFRYKRRS